MPWAITPEKVAAAVQRIASLAQPRQVILFGSVVRGEATIDSDVDILVVIADETVSPRQESVRIRREACGHLDADGHFWSSSERRAGGVGSYSGA